MLDNKFLQDYIKAYEGFQVEVSSDAANDLNNTNNAVPFSTDVSVVRDAMRMNANGTTNAYGSQCMLIADRIIIDARADYAIISSKRGTAITSAGPVKIDSGEDVVVNPTSAFYIGNPTAVNPKTAAQQNVGADGDMKYEPLILGNKLIEVLRDVIQLISTIKIDTPTGAGYLSSDIQSNLTKLNSRLTECLSTYAYIDGTKHETL